MTRPLPLAAALDAVRQRAPLVHCITNFVSMNDVANMLLAAGASPIMSAHPDEVEEVQTIASALCLNLGTPTATSLQAMKRAGETAKRAGHPILLDPVGAGISALRTRNAREIMDTLQPAVVRGNLSEMRVLIGDAASGRMQARGVDADLGDRLSPDTLPALLTPLAAFAKDHAAILVVTGKTDLVTDGTQAARIANGRPEMQRVTGTGCQLSALITAFVAAARDLPLSPFDAAVAAVTTMGVAGEIAYEALAPGDGNATYRNRLIDAVYGMSGETLEKRGKVRLCTI